MGLLFLIILILIFIIEIIYTIKNKINQTFISISALLFIFSLLSSYNNFPFVYDGIPKEEFSSYITFLIGKLTYYIGTFIFLELAIIISYIPIFKHIKAKNSDDNFIECKVCGRQIPYNEYKTCEECHQKILHSLEKKNNISTLCPNCGEKIDNNWDFCNNCGHKLKNDEIKGKHFCTSCGKEIKSDWDFCNYCGNKLK